LKSELSEILDGPATRDTVWMPGLQDSIKEQASNVGERGFVDRIRNRELKPDTVYLQEPEAYGGESTLPRYCTTLCEKKGDKFWVNIWNTETGEVQRHRYTLPNEGSDYTFQSGDQPANLSTPRTLGFLQFGGRATLYGGVGLSAESPAVIDAIIEGPIKLRSSRVEVTPFFGAGGSEGPRAGVAASITVGNF